MTINFRKPTLAILLAAAAVGSQAQALGNGDFAAGLAGWQVLGDASVQAGDTGRELWLSSASLLSEDDFPRPASAMNRSGVAAAEVGVPGGVESFAGLALGALDDVDAGLAAYEGSAARQTFSASAGDRLSFRWNFATNDAALPDYAFVAIDGRLTRLGGVAESIWPGRDGHLSETGPQAFSISFASSGSHTLAFGVVDVGDYSLTSTLAIGDVLVTPVPEAPALLLWLAGLGMGLRLVRRQRG